MWSQLSAKGARALIILGIVLMILGTHILFGFCAVAAWSNYYDWNRDFGAWALFGSSYGAVLFIAGMWLVGHGDGCLKEAVRREREDRIDQERRERIHRELWGDAGSTLQSTEN